MAISRVASQAAARYRKKTAEGPHSENLRQDDEKEYLFDEFSDVYKEVNGIRPRHVHYDNVDVEWLKRAIEDLSLQAQQELEWEREEQEHQEMVRGYEQEEAQAEEAFKEKYGEKYIDRLEDQSW
jgi:hypothetical protein